MIDTKFQYISLNRILLLAVGLWPYQRTKFVRFQIVLISSILISFIMFQFTIFTTEQLSIDLVTKILSGVLINFSHLVSYLTFWANTSNIKCVLEQLQHIYNELKDENEIAIFKEYSYRARRYTIIVTLLLICVIIIIIAQPLEQYILNVLLFINQSWSCCSMPVTTEYFIDQKKYFYIILLHVDIALVIGSIAIISIGTLFIVVFKHACGMFRIASYRIEQAMTNNTFKNINLEDEIFIYKRINYAVDMHRKAMQFSEIILNSCEKMFFFLIILSVTCLSINLFRIFYTILFGDNIMDVVLNIVYSGAIFLCMFFSNYAGQEIIDHNDNVYNTAYNFRWYIAPLHVQKQILFLLQRGTKTFNLNIAVLFIASLKGFASLASTSVSYFTVMYSVQL